MAQTLGNINFGNIPAAAGGGAVVGADEGLTLNGGNVQLGGVVPAQGIITNQRLIELQLNTGITIGGPGLNDGGKIDIQRTGGIRIDSDIAVGGQFTNYYFNPAKLNINSTGPFQIDFNGGQTIIENAGGVGSFFSSGDVALISSTGGAYINVGAGSSGLPWLDLKSGAIQGFYFYDFGGPLFDSNELNIAKNLSGAYINFADQFWAGYETANDIFLIRSANFLNPSIQIDNTNNRLILKSDNYIYYDVVSPGGHSFMISSVERFRVSAGVVLVNTTLRLTGTNTINFDTNSWRGGALITAAVTPDTTRYLELRVNGVDYRLIIST